MITNVVFDLDGVLADAVELHQRSFLIAIRQFGIDMTEQEHMELLNGRPTKDKLEILVRRNQLNPADVMRIFEIKQSVTNDLIPSLIVPMSNVIDTVRWARGWYRISVVSNSIRSTIFSVLKHAGLIEYFKNSVIISNEDVSAPKPDPSGYLAVLSENGCSSEQCLVVEDNDLGIQAAHAAGIKNIYYVPNPQSLSLIKLKEYIRACDITNGW